MSMLTLYIIKTGKIGADPVVAAQSYPWTKEVKFVEEIASVADYTKKRSPWVGYLYDDEKLSDDLALALKTFMLLTDKDALVVYKRIGRDSAEFFPRFFRSDVQLNKDDLSPISKEMSFEKVLDGWLI
jgi:hypothetical protein